MKTVRSNEQQVDQGAEGRMQEEVTAQVTGAASSSTGVSVVESHPFQRDGIDSAPLDRAALVALEIDGGPSSTTPGDELRERLAFLRRERDDARQRFEGEGYPYSEKMGRKAYEKEKAALQVELLKVQQWVKDTGQRIAILFEGQDAAGKGGTIKRFMEHLNPRGARVVALEKPNENERSQWYYQRYISHLPSAGEMVLFDRSWYNRAGVERVMGFCTTEEYLEFLRDTPQLERMLGRSGIRLFKYWFQVSQDEQLKRINARASDPLKHWKLSPVDQESLGKWDEYNKAKGAMFFYSDTKDAPWTIIRSDDKKRGRLNCMRDFLSRLDYPEKDVDLIGQPDPQIVHSFFKTES
ncbi:polyphosphate kinase 2 [Rhodovibrionaceae bacterium A322]